MSVLSQNYTSVRIFNLKVGRLFKKNHCCPINYRSLPAFAGQALWSLNYYGHNFYKQFTPTEFDFGKSR